MSHFCQIEELLLPQLLLKVCSSIIFTREYCILQHCMVVMQFLVNGDSSISQFKSEDQMLVLSAKFVSVVFYLDNQWLTVHSVPS